MQSIITLALSAPWRLLYLYLGGCCGGKMKKAKIEGAQRTIEGEMIHLFFQSAPQTGIPLYLNEESLFV